MKNKGLIATLILLTILVVGELFYNKSEKHLNLSEKQVVKIGILQYVPMMLWMLLKRELKMV